MNALLLSLTLLSSAARPAPGAIVGTADDLARLKMEPVELATPSGESRTVYRGMLRVPIVRADPDSKEIGVDVWRFPADEGVEGDAVPVFQLMGGPGWPGYEPSDIDWINDVGPYVAYGDLVVVGQRGIGTSEPDTSCARFTPGAGAEDSDEERIGAGCRACREHWEGEGYDLTGFNVIEAAGDVNDVRRLLGYEKIAILGGSFGSHWGMTVMRYHPDIVARAVLHGMEGPNHTYDSPSGVLGALERIAEQAEASPALAERIPEEGLIGALRFVIESIEEGPFEIDVDGRPVEITAKGLRGLATGYENRVNSRRTVAGWPSDVIRLYEGDFEGAARALRSNAGIGGLPTASFFQLDCGSGITAARLAELQSDPAIAIVGDTTSFYEAACSAWNADLGDDFRADFRTDIPTVVVHGTWDVSTPFENALELVPCFRNLHFIPVEGGTHGALTECRRDVEGFEVALMSFLYGGKVDGLPKEVELEPIAWTGTW